jgi:hypothetical protein
MSMESYVGMISTGKCTASTRALWQFCQQRHLVANKEVLAKEMLNFAYEVSLQYFEGFFNMP